MPSSAPVPVAGAGPAATRPGRVHVYTGDGKGKTTAAFGLALRAAGHGQRVLVVQFLKSGALGEVAALAGHPLIEVEQYAGGRRRRACSPEPPSPLPPAGDARRGLARARAAVADGRYALVVLDEVDVAWSLGLLSEADLLALLEARRPEVEVVFTGRGAPAALLARADLVTEMRAVRHYFASGTPARAGVEY